MNEPRFLHLLRLGGILFLFGMASAQESTVAERWLAKAGPIPPFQIPATQADWEKRRPVIRTTLEKLLGYHGSYFSPLQTPMYMVKAGEKEQQAYDPA